MKQICLEMLSGLHRTNVPQGGHSLWIKAWEQLWLLLQGKLQWAIMERDKNLCSQRGTDKLQVPFCMPAQKPDCFRLFVYANRRATLILRVGLWSGARLLIGWVLLQGWQPKGQSPSHSFCTSKTYRTSLVIRFLEQALLLDFREEVCTFGIDFGTVGPAALDLIKDPIPYFLHCFP